MDDNKNETILERIRKNVLDISDPELAEKLWTYDEEVKHVERYLRLNYGGCASALPTMADRCLAEIEFYIANDLIRHLCAVAADFYERMGSVAWAPVGFFIGGGSYREIHIRFHEYDDQTREIIYYDGVLSRNTERGEKYNLVVNAKPGQPDSGYGCRAIFDIINKLGVPRAYIDGLFDMAEHGEECFENEQKLFEKERDHHYANMERMSERTRQLEYEVKRLSQQLQALKRPQKWKRKRTPRLDTSDHTKMPPPPTNVMSAVEAQLEYGNCAGIYFFWDTEHKCAYVGKSKNVYNRLNGHEKLSNYAVTVLPLAPEDIHFAELYYIWLLRPYVNKEGVDTQKTIEAANKKKVTNNG